MADLNIPDAHVLLAKLDIGIDEQHIVIEGKELRLLELDEEQAHIEADIVAVEAKALALEADLKKLKDPATIEARRLSIKGHELRLAIKNKRLRLLEQDVERTAIGEDIEASRQHIAKLETEVRQQQARLKE